MYANYFNDDRIKTGILATLLAIIRFGIVLSIYIQTRKESNNIHNWIFAITLFYYVLALYMNLFDRVAAIFFMICVFITMENMINYTTKNKYLYYFSLLVVLFVYQLVTLYFRPEWNCIYPYKFYWQV